jgi:DNA-binding NarL/FixJ family response regulator
MVAVITLAARRVWIDEADSIFRRGLGGWLVDYGFTVAGESTRLDPPPPLAEVDILLFELASVDAALALERPAALHMVALTSSVRSDDLLFTSNGALSGIVARDGLTPEGLATSLSAVASGQGSVPLDALSGLAAEVRDARRRASDELHDRELAVLRLLADGGSTNEIATELAYSERTVKNIVHDVLMKLDCRTRAHAVALATRQGVI